MTEYRVTPTDDLKQICSQLEPGDQVFLEAGQYVIDGTLAIRAENRRLGGIRFIGSGAEKTRIRASKMSLFNCSDMDVEHVGFDCPMHLHGNRWGANMHGIHFKNTWHRSTSHYQIFFDSYDEGRETTPRAIEHCTLDSITLEHQGASQGPLYGLILNGRNVDALRLLNCRLFARRYAVLVGAGNIWAQGGVCGALETGHSMWILGNNDSHVLSGLKFEPQGDSNALVIGAGRPEDVINVSAHGCDLKCPAGKHPFWFNGSGSFSLAASFVAPHGGSAPPKLRPRLETPSDSARPLIVGELTYYPNTSQVGPVEVRGNVQFGKLPALTQE